MELVSTQGIGWQHNTICMCAMVIPVQIVLHTCWTAVPVYNPSPGAWHNVLSREKVKSNFYVSYRIAKRQQLTLKLRAKRLSAVHAFMARGCQFPKSLQINYSNEESGERRAVLKN